MAGDAKTGSCPRLRQSGSTGSAAPRWQPSPWLTRVVVLAIIIVAWSALTGPYGIIGRARFPSPADVIGAAEQVITTGYAGGTLFVQIWHSLRLILLGYAVASVTGVGLGLLMGMIPRAERLINPAFLLLRPIPPLAWIPLAILWFGLGDASKIFLIWYAAFVPCVINTITGVRGIDATVISAARVHGASDWQIASEVVIPGALPMIFTGLRLSLQSCWTTLVAAELVGAFFGIGRVLMSAAQDVYPGMILFAMACVALLGAGTSLALSRVERRVLPWRQT